MSSLRDKTLVRGAEPARPVRGIDRRARCPTRPRRARPSRPLPAAQTGFTLDLADLKTGNIINLTYTDTATNTQRQISIVRVDDPTCCRCRTRRRPIPTTRWSASIFPAASASVVAQLNAALERSNLQFSGTGSALTVLNNAGFADRQCGVGRRPRRSVADAAAARSCRCSPTTARPTPARSPRSGSQMTGLAGRLTVNNALGRRSLQAGGLQQRRDGRPATRRVPTFILAQLTTAKFHLLAADRRSAAPARRSRARC